MTQTQTMPFPWFGTHPFTPDVQGFFERLMALPKIMEIARRIPKGCTPSEIVYEEDNLRLLRYTWGPEKKYATPLLIVFALVNRSYILDLMPAKSVVRHFLRAGFDVYLIDWGVPTYGDRHVGLERYIETYQHNVVDYIRERTGQEQINLMGYCMGGTMSAMYAALHPDRIKNLILMTAPIDFSQRESLLSLWSDERYFDVDSFVEVFGNAPPQYLQFNFQLLKPVTNFVEKYFNFYEKMTDERFLEEFIAMEQWVNDNIPVAGETFRQFVRYGFQQNLLIKNQWPIGRKRVNLRNIACPVLNLMATADHLVPCGQSRGFNDLVASKDRTSIEFPAGHIGLAVGSKAQAELWPKACDWLAQRSDPLDDE
ncbi:MAG: class III poly(R)-hydroxyalkanoic acid synthase subunit PhaC [Phycisphaerae bacterium]|nr:class III poly(R)-hydroxyalkanoic acid synthase subunit PhaC [Phycisphaerae bacterium]